MENLTHLTIEDMPYPAFIINNQGKITEANQLLSNLTEHCSPIIGQTVTQLKTLLNQNESEIGSAKIEIKVHKIVNNSEMASLGILSIATTPSNPEAQTPQSEVFLKNIVKNMSGNIYWKSPAGVILGCNDSLAQCAGFDKAEDAIGKTDDDFVWHEFAEQIRQNDHEVMHAKTPFTFEEPATLRDGSSATFLTIKAPILDDSNCAIGVLGISLNITQQKKLEKDLISAKTRAEAANNAKSYFLSCSGHELRTPLVHILSIARLLLKNDSHLNLDEKIQFIKDLVNSAVQLKELVDDLLTYASTEIGTTQVNNSIIDIKPLLEDMHRIFKLQTPNTIDLVLRCDGNNLWASGDKKRLKQVLNNLINNAIKFTQKGKIEILAQKNIQTNTIEVHISDTGIGIPENKLTDIWQAFTQVHSDNTDLRMGRYSGLGLGLALVKYFIEQMEGTVRASSISGQGSIFSFTIPAAQTNKEA